MGAAEGTAGWIPSLLFATLQRYAEGGEIYSRDTVYARVRFEQALQALVWVICFRRGPEGPRDRTPSWNGWGVPSLLEVEFWLALFTALLADELVYLCLSLSRPPSVAFLRRHFCRDGASFADWTGD